MSEPGELSRRIDVIERGYEYLLAYAAQGRQNDAGSEARQTLQNMFAALDGLGELLATAVSAFIERRRTRCRRLPRGHYAMMRARRAARSAWC